MNDERGMMNTELKSRGLPFRVHRSAFIVYLKLLVLIVFIIGFAAYLFTDFIATRKVLAYSSGPPAGFTHAPGEFDCSECHLHQPDAGTGHISITAPASYVPGQTYQITVTHTNADTTRLRWGFQLTALDDAQEKAGDLQSLNPLTQVLNNQGPGSSRQYIEHTSSGTFINQQGGASWTFNWTAPPTSVGPVTFYAAGNQANNDANTSGDYIYYTFVQAQPAAITSDFSITATPSSQTVAPGNGTTYNLTLTPTAGFTGQVNLSINSSLPAGVTANFNSSSVIINDASTKSSTLTVTTTASTPVGTFPLTITAISGSLQHTANASLKVVSNTSADLLLTQTASPNPAAIGTNLSYRLTVTNNGPASATHVNVTDTLPSGITLVSATTTQGSCNGTATVICNLDTLANGANAIVTIVVTPTISGQITNTASVSGSEADPDTANNSATTTTVVDAPPPNPILLDQNLSVKRIMGGLDQPTSMAFLGANEFFVLEKATGKVQHIFNAQMQPAALDLAVNNASERGLLGIALHPNFPATPFVYLYWTESSTGVDTSNTDEIPLLGNRVDRFIWNGSTLTLDRNLIKLRSLQADAGQPTRGNHNGGVIRFGPDGKLYIIIGDNGRRGLLQNITNGGTVPDDQFGGPEPDNAHLTGVILRLNDDGATPSDNPFFNATTTLTGEAAANIKKIFAYGVRNGFGMAFDPVNGNLWTQENGDDAFDEINRVTAGFNGGWTQIMGPSGRISEFKSIESTYGAGNLQQIRWSPTLIADTPQQALSRLYQLPGSHYTEPEFSWKYAVAPSPIGFVRGGALGAQFDGDMFVGASRTTLYNGYLFRLKLSGDRLKIATTDPRLQDKVADNLDKFDITESESLLIGKNFGITTDIQTGPDGNLYLVSLSNGAVYQIFANNTLQLSSSVYSVAESASSASVTVTRTGNTSGAVTINYATSDTAGLTNCNIINGIASSRCDYATSVGTLRFAAGETSKTISIPIVDDNFTEGNETFILTLSNPVGATLGATASTTITITDNANTAGNPIDSVPFFVRQHYIDFLGREPDSFGFKGWQDILNNCTAGDTTCDRIEVSSRFFRSAEFQERGYFTYRFYSASFGRKPNYEEFIPDVAKVSGFLTEAEKEANKVAFVDEFMQRTEFRNKYDSTLNSPTAYVDALLQTSGLPNHPSRAGWIAGLQNGSLTRARVLRELAESAELSDKYFVEAFVVMQYFGYLRRNPDKFYLDWIVIMNQDRSNYRNMVNGFMNSTEYRARFGP